jgi:hypothetical protein
MNETENRFLTEVMGGCWHEWAGKNCAVHTPCSKCKKTLGEAIFGLNRPSGDFNGHPDFLTDSTWYPVFTWAMDDAAHDKDVVVMCWKCGGNKRLHWSDCATNDGPAYPPGPCNCETFECLLCHGSGKVTIGPWTYKELCIRHCIGESVNMVTKWHWPDDFIGPAFPGVLVEYLKTKVVP